MNVELLEGSVNGGSLVPGVARFKDEGDHWQLWGSLCYVKDGSEDCHGNVWLPKDSLEVCITVNIFTPGSLFAQIFEGETRCSGRNGKPVREVSCD